MLELFAGDAVVRGESAISSARTGSGNGIVWITIGDESVRRLTGAEARPETPRRILADLLKWIRERARPRPTLVYLDVAIAPRVTDQDGEARLAEQLARWSRDAGAPPLAIFAGTSCSAPALPSSAAAQWLPFIPFDPGPYRSVVGHSSPAERSAQARIVWSCPLFAGLRQAEWSCVTSAPGTAAGPMQSFAMPSPAWFAESVRTTGRASSPAMTANLAAADRVCDRRDPAGTSIARPMFSRVRIDASGNGTFEQMKEGSVGAAALLASIPVHDLLGAAAEPSALADSIVVIGGGGSWFRDTVMTSRGEVPGPLVVAGTLRDVHRYGLYRPPSAIRDSLLTLFLFMLLGLLLRLAHPGLQARAVSRFRGWRKPAAYLLLHRQVAVAALVGALFLLPAWLGADLTLALAWTVLLLELMIFTDEAEKEWMHVRTAR